MLGCIIGNILGSLVGAELPKTRDEKKVYRVALVIVALFVGVLLLFG